MAEMPKMFGDWQSFLNNSVEKLLKSEDSFNLFKNLSSDNERIMFISELQFLNEVWINDYFENSDKFSMKSSQVAKNFRKEGNGHFEKKRFKDALSCYNDVRESIADISTELPSLGVLENPVRLPVQDVLGGHYSCLYVNRLYFMLSMLMGDEEICLGLANRSAVTFHLGYYELSLVDIQEATSRGYSKNLQYRLLQRKGQCFFHLCQWQLAVEAFTSAEESLISESCTEPNKQASIQKEIKRWIEKTSSNMSSSGLIDLDRTDISSIPTPVNGCSTVLKQATSAVSLQCTSEKGRHLVANSGLTAGDVLIVERPYTSLLLPTHYTVRCYHCLSKLIIAMPCPCCVVVRYCSTDCQRTSWKSYHNVECSILDLLHSIGIAHLSLRIVLMSGIEFLLDFHDKIEKMKNDDVIAGISSDGTYDLNYLSVYSLLPHSTEMTAEDLFQYTLTAALLLECLKKSPFFDSCSAALVNSSALGSLRNVELYIGGLLLRHICQLVCNAHAITELESTQFSESSLVDMKSQVRVATAIYPTASLMNHSCDPTIISSFIKDTLIVRAIKNVASGDEIYNCYGPHCKRMTRSERQTSLREQYFFDCCCNPCSEEAKNELRYKALKCTRCEGPLVGGEGVEYKCVDCGHCPESVERQLLAVEESRNMFIHGLQMLDQKQINGALVCFRKCFDLRKQNVHKMNKDLAEVQDAMARCYAITGDFTSAHKFLSSSIKTTEFIYGGQSIELANELQKFAEICVHASKMPDARMAAKKAVDIFTTNYGAECEPVTELTEMLDSLAKFC